jgi:anti-sigma B factor antagonist
VTRAAYEFVVRAREHDTETIVISVEGELDFATAPEFERELVNAVRYASGRVVVDLTATTFFDSSAIRALVAGSRRLEASGAETCVVCSGSAVERVLQITGVDRLLEVYATLEDAVRQRSATGNGQAHMTQPATA